MNRRKFFGHMVGGAALSLYAMRELNAAIYDDLKSLNKKFQESPDGVYWDAVRKHYHLEDNLIMMNNGTVGPIPKPVFNTMMENFEIQLKAPCDCYMQLPRKSGTVRAKRRGEAACRCPGPASAFHSSTPRRSPDRVRVLPPRGPR